MQLIHSEICIDGWKFILFYVVLFIQFGPREFVFTFIQKRILESK